MLEVKEMSIPEFLKTEHLANKEELKKMYLKIRDNCKSKYCRPDYSSMPLYECNGSVFGGGDCIRVLSHREGYGYTVIDVGDRGSWMCVVGYGMVGKKKIRFYDGEFEEVYEELLKHF